MITAVLVQISQSVRLSRNVSEEDCCFAAVGWFPLHQLHRFTQTAKLSIALLRIDLRKRTRECFAGELEAATVVGGGRCGVARARLAVDTAVRFRSTAVTPLGAALVLATETARSSETSQRVEQRVGVGGRQHDRQRRGEDEEQLHWMHGGKSKQTAGCDWKRFIYIHEQRGYLRPPPAFLTFGNKYRSPRSHTCIPHTRRTVRACCIDDPIAPAQ